MASQTFMAQPDRGKSTAPFHGGHPRIERYDWDRPAQTMHRAHGLWPLCQRILACGALVLLSPLLVFLFLAVKLTSKGPFIYRQRRPGLNGRPFTAFKIRSMCVGADCDPARARQVDRADPMITPIGRILRDLKLDELPQLINVARGEMALVGPRPIAPTLQEELERDIPGFARRLQVRPGLTSLAQVCIFDNEDADHVVDDWSRRFEAELDYIYRRSAIYDMVIIALTVGFILRKIARKIPLRARYAPLLLLFLPLGACSEHMSTRPFKRADTVYEKDIRAYGDRSDPAPIEIQPVSVPAEETEAEDPNYRVGSGDRLQINIFGEPGLDSLDVAVDGSGRIQVPYLEHVDVAGATVTEIQARLKDGFSAQFRDPWVVVQISAYRSRPVYLLGQFNNPGVVYLDGPTNLLQAMSMGRGLSELAHLRGARLWRDGRIAAVDMQALLVGGQAEHNIFLRPGDTLYVPSKTDKKAYVLGAVLRAGAVPFGNDPMTLMKALTQVGGPIKSKALLSQVRVIRTHSALEGQLILINAKDILKGKVPDLALMPDDIVYVPDNWVESWNQVVSAVTPTLQLAGGALQPFVQVKFLKGD